MYLTLSKCESFEDQGALGRAGLTEGKKKPVMYRIESAPHRPIILAPDPIQL